MKENANTCLLAISCGWHHIGDIISACITGLGVCTENEGYSGDRPVIAE